MKIRTWAGLGFASALLLGLGACDPAPQAELTNKSGQTVILRSATIVHGFYDSGRPVDATIAPDKAVRYIPWGPLRLRAGPCELTYAVPDLPMSSGVILPFEVWPDEKLYLRALKGEDLKYYGFALKAQPPGWPLEPAKTGCP